MLPGLLLGLFSMLEKNLKCPLCAFASLKAGLHWNASGRLNFASHYQNTGLWVWASSFSPSLLSLNQAIAGKLGICFCLKYVLLFCKPGLLNCKLASWHPSLSLCVNVFKWVDFSLWAWCLRKMYYILSPDVCLCSSQKLRKLRVSINQ